MLTILCEPPNPNFHRIPPPIGTQTVIQGTESAFTATCDGRLDSPVVDSVAALHERDGIPFPLKGLVGANGQIEPRVADCILAAQFSQSPEIAPLKTAGNWQVVPATPAGHDASLTEAKLQASSLSQIIWFDNAWWQPWNKNSGTVGMSTTLASPQNGVKEQRIDARFQVENNVVTITSVGESILMAAAAHLDHAATSVG